MTLILIESFPKMKISIIVIMGVAVAFIVVSLTVFRTGSASIIIGGSGLNQTANSLQIYLGGPSSIAAGINVMKEKVSFENLIFDWIRSIFPLNLIFKNAGYTTSQLYNLNLYNGLFKNGQIVFGEAYSYIYFGIIGCWINLIVNTYLMFRANEIFYLTDNFEIKYLSGYCMIRLVQAGLTNTQSILGSVTQIIGTF